MSPEERKRRFKLGDKQPEGELSKDVIEPPAQDAQTAQDTQTAQDAQKSPMLEGIKSPLKAIAESIDRIKDSLTGQSKVQEDAVEDARKSDEEKEAKKRESGLEKFLGPVKAAGEKIIAPVKSIFSKIFDFIRDIFLGRIAFKLFQWFADPSNTDKVKSIFKFISDFWPVLLAGIMAFLPGLLGPGGLILGTIALLAWGVPKIVNAVKSIFGFGKDIDKELKTGSDKLNKDISTSAKEAENKLDPGGDKIPTEAQGDPSKASTPAELSGVKDSQKEVQNLNKGGEVEGRGDKDTVPAMLTPGEFVMSKGAVEQYGVKTLEGMNAAAGGTNMPTMKKGGDKGMNLSVPRFGGGGTATATPMSQEDFVAAAMPGMQMFMQQQNAAVDENPEAYNGIKLELDRDGKMPNFGEFIYNQGEAEFNKGLEMVQNNESLDPEIKEAVIKKAIFVRSQTLDDPNFKGDLSFDINKDIPGTAANRLLMRAQADTTSPAALAGISADDRARQMNRMGFAGGGLVGRMKNAGANVLGKAKAQLSKLQKPRVDHIHPPADPVSNAGAAQVAQSSSDAVTASTEPAPGIPDFDAGMMRSQSKIRTLGVSV